MRDETNPLNLNHLSERQTEALTEMVLTTAAHIGARVLNDGDSLAYLLANGWTQKEIHDELADATSGTGTELDE